MPTQELRILKSIAFRHHGEESCETVVLHACTPRVLGNQYLHD